MFGSSIGVVEILVVALVLLVLFAPQKIPDSVRGMREFIKELKRSFHEGKKEAKKNK